MRGFDSTLYGQARQNLPVMAERSDMVFQEIYNRLTCL